MKINGSVQHAVIKRILDHPQVVANLYEFISFAEHKERYFENGLELWHH